MSETNFFGSQTLSSKVKANIVAEYFPQYCKIITKMHKPERIGYFDLFAGPGKYDDGNLSTPLLIAKKCNGDPFLRQKVWMVFNDNIYSEQLKKNFTEIYPTGTFKFNPHFGHSTVGECDEINVFIKKDWTKHGKNECPSVLFIDPFGYKGVNTITLSQFLRYWGNELFIFVNTKRINPALENEKFEGLMRDLFPYSYDTLKKSIREQNSVPKRLQYIINQLGNEYKIILGGDVYFTAFKFQEEDQETTSHFILHLTKSKRGFDLIKQIYNDFANVGTVFDGINTYTFDMKKIKNPVKELFDVGAENIEVLKEKLYNKYKGRTISAIGLFEEHQKNELYCRKHYVQALRSLVDDHKIKAKFYDDKNHNVSVLLINECVLTFE